MTSSSVQPEAPTPKHTAQPSGPIAFGDAVRACFSKYAAFEGRASRAEFWYWSLFSFLADLGVSIVSIFLFGAGSLVLSGLYWLCILGLALPGLAVTVRRLHDTNRSGWWYMIVLTIIGAIPLTIWFCEEGTQGDNKYGPR